MCRPCPEYRGNMCKALTHVHPFPPPVIFLPQPALLCRPEDCFDVVQSTQRLKKRVFVPPSSRERFRTSTYFVHTPPVPFRNEGQECAGAQGLVLNIYGLRAVGSPQRPIRDHKRISHTLNGTHFQRRVLTTHSSKRGNPLPEPAPKGPVKNISTTYLQHSYTMTVPQRYLYVDLFGARLSPPLRCVR